MIVCMDLMIGCHSPAEPEPKVHYRHRRAGMLLLQGFAPHPTYYASKTLVRKGNFGAWYLQRTEDRHVHAHTLFACRLGGPAYRSNGGELLRSRSILARSP